MSRYLQSPLLLWVLILILLSTLIFLLLAFKRYMLIHAHSHMHYDYEMLRIRLEVEEEALNMMSRELHDNIGQVLTSSYMQLIATSAQLPDRNDIREMISPAVTGIIKSIRGLGQLSNVLNGQTIEKMGFIDAMEKELAFTASVYHLDCIFNYSKQVPELNKEQDLMLFRIVQEALNNIYRHAAADKAVIDIGFANNRLIITITHNGMVTETNTSKGSALHNIKERIKLLKGSMDIKTDPGRGTTLVLTCNLKT
jgi:two-component system NarL family sensor kinase